MTPKKLVSELLKLPKETFLNAEIRVVRNGEEDEENHWVGENIEFNEKGQSGYTTDGEVRIFTNV